MDFQFLKQKNKLFQKENKGLKATFSDMLASHGLKEHNNDGNK